MTSFSLFVVDDEKVAREGIALALRKTYQVMDFPTAESAIEAMQSHTPDLVLLDIGLPGMSGIEALEQIKQRFPDMLVIMITAYEDIKTVVSAMKLGAHDYIIKPLQMDALHVTVRNALETIALRKEIRLLHERFLKENLPCFIGESDVIQDVMDIVTRVAQSPDTPILILGETGTGKELIARAVHYRSPSFNKPLVSVNCAAIPKNLIESELFGYEKGAFSGADASGKKGLVEEASNGTLFLDEVSELSLEAQAKILRFLENGEYYRVGGTRKLQVKTRIVSATNRPLFELVEEGAFRRDLYYRLAVVKIEVPSLNQRRDDIIPMARHYLIEFNEKFGKQMTKITPEAESVLKSYYWTGNVRELKNIMERGILLSDGPELTLGNLGLEREIAGRSANDAQESIKLPAMLPAGVDMPSIIKTIEKHYFKEALRLADGNESKAAQLLQISRDTFRYRRKSHG